MHMCLLVGCALIHVTMCNDCLHGRRLMVEAQQQFDALAQPLCPEQLTAHVLHRLLQHPSIQVKLARCWQWLTLTWHQSTYQATHIHQVTCFASWTCVYGRI
jgi:hypothetical protein